MTQFPMISFYFISIFLLLLFSGDNSDIVATDSQKNTVYLLAKKFGIKSPEDFAFTLTKHFLTKYRHVKEAHVHIDEYPWERISYTNADNQPKKHNHAFLFTPIATRYCDIIHQRGKFKISFAIMQSIRIQTQSAPWNGD